MPVDSSLQVQIDTSQSVYWVVRFLLPRTVPGELALAVPSALLAGQGHEQVVDIILRYYVTHCPAAWPAQPASALRGLVRDAVDPSLIPAAHA